MHNEIGIAGYSPGQMRRSPRQIYEKIQRKCALRAALCAISAEIEAAVPDLNASELQELQQLMQADIESVDADTAELQAQVAEEAKLSKTQKAMKITISRRASAILGAEAERRIQRGVFASAESLVVESLERSYAR